MANENMFSIAILDGHSALRLKCSSCDNGNPHFAAYGIYAIEELRPKSEHMFANGEWLDLLILLSSTYTCEVRDDSGMFNQRVRSKPFVQSHEYIFNKFPQGSSQQMIVDLPINNEQAIAALQEVRDITNSCKNETILLRPLNNNCADFIQRVFVAAGFTDHFGNHFSDEMLLGNINEMSGYIYIRSRGIQHAWAIGSKVFQNKAKMSEEYNLSDNLEASLMQLREGKIPKGDFDFIKAPCYYEEGSYDEQSQSGWGMTMPLNKICLITELGQIDLPNYIMESFTNCTVI